MLLEKRGGKLPPTNKSQGVRSEGPALGLPTPGWTNEPYFSLPRAPGPSPLLPKPGKIFPNLIPSPPGEKPNCTRDLEKIWETESERERESGAGRGQANCGGNAWGEVESSRASAKTPFGRKSQHSWISKGVWAHTPLSPTRSGQVTGGRPDHQCPLSFPRTTRPAPSCSYFYWKKERRKATEEGLKKAGKESAARNPAAICQGGE